MSALSEREYLAEEICELYSKLAGDASAEDLARAKELAQAEAPHDHWLQTNKLDYESRLFLYLSAAYAMRCMKSEPYKCAVFMRNAAEALTRPKSG